MLRQIIPRPARRLIRRLSFDHSSQYWERRYARGGNSGEGSYGLWAAYKAGVLNELVRDEQVGSIIEFGVGDGHQLGLAEYLSFIGLDVSPTALDLCIQRFGDDPTKGFCLYDPLRFRDPQGVLRAEMSISLDVIYHLVEDDVFEKYMLDLFGAAERLVVVYATNQEKPRKDAHVRHRHWTPWVAEKVPGWRLAEAPQNPHAEQSGSTASFFVFRRITD